MHMLYFIKYFAIVLYGVYSYIQLLNLPQKKKLAFPTLLFTVCLSLLAALSETVFPHTTILVLILVSVLFFSFMAPATSPEICITAMIISYGISYIAFSISIVAALFILISEMSKPDYSHFLSQILTAVIQILIVHIPFRFKRLKKGMPFLTNRLSRFPLMITSLLVLFLALLMSIQGTLLLSFPVCLYLCHIHLSFMEKQYYQDLPG